MKNFSQFIKEEVSIKGNKGLPEEKLRDIERKGAEKIRGEQPGGLIGQIRGLMGESGRFITGNQKKLEKLAEEVLRDTYPLILKNVDLDLQLVTDGGKVADFMKKEEKEKEEELKEEEKDKKQAEEEEKEEEQEEEQEESGEQEQQQELDKDALKLALDKRKFANNIIQGEAKNTKFILHQDITKDGLTEIYGDRAPEAIRVWNEISKIADKLDWIIPIEHKAQMMERQPEGMAGATSARFKKKAISKKKKKEQEDLIKEIKQAIEEGKDIKNEEMQKKISEVLGYLNPTVKVRAVDFPMLLHEAVKGVYELIADVGMNRDERMAKEVHRQTSTFLDEAEDFRYGPYLAQDLNDFVMKNPDAQKYPNIKEYVFGKLIDSDRWSDDECLENLKNIFLESPRGRKLLDDLITETIEELDNYERQMSEWKDSKRDNRQMTDEEESDIDKLVKQTLYGEGEEEPVSKKSYDDMTISEIQDEIEKAVEEENYELAGELTKKYLKGESKKIWERELLRINESHSFHGRTK
jgi:hypothetical protein